jgi:competence protein ComEA
MDYVRRYWHIIAAVVCVAVLGVFYLRRDTGPPVVHTAERTVLEATPGYENISAPAPRGDIVVHVEGAVNDPGVYTLPYGSRVNDALALAGGPTEEADLARVNLAAFLSDAQQVLIPAEGEDFPLTTSGAAGDTGGLVNINTADAAQLRTLPGVGEVIAGNIISHREANGPFAAVDQLINVPRIGAATLENLRDLITVGG